MQSKRVSLAELLKKRDSIASEGELLPSCPFDHASRCLTEKRDPSIPIRSPLASECLETDGCTPKKEIEVLSKICEAIRYGLVTHMPPEKSMKMLKEMGIIRSTPEGEVEIDVGVLAAVVACVRGCFNTDDETSGPTYSKNLEIVSGGLGIELKQPSLDGLEEIRAYLENNQQRKGDQRLI